MAANTPRSTPAEITAGDTVTWRRPGVDYPPVDGWSLACTLVGTGKVYRLTAEVSGDDFAFTAAASITAAWDAGVYRVQVYATKDDARHTLEASTLRVLPDLAAAGAGMDTRTHAQKVLDNINGWLETEAPVYGAMELNGRKISYYPLPDLLLLRDRYQRDVRAEQATANGCGRSRRTLVRF